MSSSHAGSRDGSFFSRGMDDPVAAHDRVPAERVTDLTLFDNVDGAAEDFFQVCVNLGRVFEGKAVTGAELEHNVDVTVGAEVIGTKDGAEQRELFNAVLRAERFDLLQRQLDGER